MNEKATTGRRPNSRIDEVLEALPTIEEIDIKQAIECGMWTPNFIAKRLRMGNTRALIHLANLNAEGLAYVVTWTPNPNCAPIWIKGKGVSAPKPAPLTREQVNARRYERLRQARLEAGEIKQTAQGQGRAITYDTIDRARKAPQTWLSALGVDESREALL